VKGHHQQSVESFEMLLLVEVSVFPTMVRVEHLYPIQIDPGGVPNTKHKSQPKMSEPRQRQPTRRDESELLR